MGMTRIELAAIDAIAKSASICGYRLLIDPLVRGDQIVRDALSRGDRVHRLQLREPSQRGQQRPQFIAFRHSRQRVLRSRFNAFNGVVAEHARHVEIALRSALHPATRPAFAHAGSQSPSRKCP